MAGQIADATALAEPLEATISHLSQPGRPSSSPMSLTLLPQMGLAPEGGGLRRRGYQAGRFGSWPLRYDRDGTSMCWKTAGFGSIEIDGIIYEHDVVLDRGQVRKRRKKRSKGFRSRFGHTPLSAAEEIPWRCRRLIIGTGAHGALPVMTEVREEAERRHVRLILLPTPKAVARLNRGEPDTNAIVHVTC